MVVVMKKVSEDFVMNVKAARKEWGNALVLDSTISGAMKKLDPDFPIGKVKVPGSRWMEGQSIMSIWEGLKVFSKKDVVDLSFLKDEKKLGKRRGCKSYGKLVGIKIGDEVIDVERAVEEVFVKVYKETVMSRFGNTIECLKNESEKRTVVLLDYAEGDERYPVSHVEILKEMIDK